MSEELWKKCSSCKKPIAFASRYWVCSVSTCNRARTALVFCSVTCWDAHLPLVRHRRGTSAIERRTPSRKQYEEELAQVAAKAAEEEARKAMQTASASSRAAATSTRDAEDFSGEVLVVASRVKDYVEQRAQLRVSKTALHALSHLVRRESDLAIDAARADERKTVLDRDFIRPLAGTKDGPVMVVVSKLKGYVKARAGMNTGNACAEVLSAHIRGWLNGALRAAREKQVETLIGAHFDGL